MIPEAGSHPRYFKERLPQEGCNLDFVNLELFAKSRFIPQTWVGIHASNGVQLRFRIKKMYRTFCVANPTDLQSHLDDSPQPTWGESFGSGFCWGAPPPA